MSITTKWIAQYEQDTAKRNVTRMIGNPMMDFESWEAYPKFASIKYNDMCWTRKASFLATVLGTSDKRKALLKKDQVLWRA